MYFMCAQDLDWSISALCVDSKKKKKRVYSDELIHCGFGGI